MVIAVMCSPYAGGVPVFRQGGVKSMKFMDNGLGMFLP